MKQQDRERLEQAQIAISDILHNKTMQFRADKTEKWVAVAAYKSAKDHLYALSSGTYRVAPAFEAEPSYLKNEVELYACPSDRNSNLTIVVLRHVDQAIFWVVSTSNNKPEENVTVIFRGMTAEHQQPFLLRTQAVDFAKRLAAFHIDHCNNPRATTPRPTFAAVVREYL